MFEKMYNNLINTWTAGYMYAANRNAFITK